MAIKLTRRAHVALLLLLALAVMHYGATTSMGLNGNKREHQEQEQEQEEEEEMEGEELFLLQDTKHVIKTDAGDMKVVRSLSSDADGGIVDRPLHIGFITMEPQTLFVPQYLDSSLILFVRRGEAKLGLIYKDELAERRLKMGDIYRIPAGSPFYLVNTAEGQRLHMVCSIDPSESLGLTTFQSFFIGGGTYPTSVLAGFEPETLATALNVTMDEIQKMMTRQEQGPIVYIGDSRPPRKSAWSKFLELEERPRLQHLKKLVDYQQEEPCHEEEQSQTIWSWRKVLNSLFAPLEETKKKGEKGGKSPDAYNLYGKRPDFRNSYGWSLALDESDYEPLRHSGIGVYLVNLTAGSMMAPHVNPRATEYGIVLGGSGSIQIVYPNGTQAMNTKVKEGDVFWIPKYFPFCQIASRSGPLEFFGFTTSAQKNRPQFLVGASSVLQTLKGPELAASFGVGEEQVRRFVEAQREAVILPSAEVAPPDQEVVTRVPKATKNDMFVGFA